MCNLNRKDDLKKEHEKFGTQRVTRCVVLMLVGENIVEPKSLAIGREEAELCCGLIN